MTSPVDPPPTWTPGPPFTHQRQDATTTEQWDAPSRVYRRYEYGIRVVERPFTDAENAWTTAAATDVARQGNRVTLLQQARAALLGNQTYLAKVQAGTATNSDHIAQVPALTRQMQGVLRLLVASDLLDSTQ